MKKRSYRKISLKGIALENVLGKLEGRKKLFVAIDVAKCRLSRYSTG